MIRRYLSGQTTDAIAAELGLSKWAVRDELRRHGTPMRPPGRRRPASTVPPALEVQEMIRRYLSGQSVDAIAAELGLSKWVVRYELRRHGTPMRPPGRRPRS
jgi:DNA-binding CsgD family transcriptional regulator